MDQQRKQIIIKEIKFWKENRMLPEQYCDYLLSIYTEGELKDNSQIFGYHKLWALLGVLPILMIPFVTYLLYFTELSLNLQILIFLSVFLFLVINAVLLTSKKLIWRHITYLVIAIIILELIVEGVGTLINLSATVMGIILFVNCTLWIVIGFLKKLTYFIYSGVSLIILSIAYILYLM